MANNPAPGGFLGGLADDIDKFAGVGGRPTPGTTAADRANAEARAPIANTGANAALSPRPASAKGGGERVLDQIESDADYYGPHIYSELLSFYSNFFHFPDSLSAEFIPVTQVKANPKMFVVGLIPPAANITGRLLSRAGSVGSVLGAPEDVDLKGTGGGNGNPTAAGSGAQRIPNADGTLGNANQGSGPNLPPAFWDDYVKMCQRLKVSPHAMAGVIDGESGFNPNAQNKQRMKDGSIQVVAKGLNQFVYSTAKGYMDKASWDSYQDLSAQEQLPYLEKFMRSQNVAGKTSLQIYGRNFGNYGNPDGSMYAGKARQEEWIASHPGAVFRDGAYQQTAIEQNAGLAGGKGYIELNDLGKYVAGKPSQGIRNQIDSALGRVGGGSPPTKIPAPSETSNGEWQNKGSANASKVKKEESKTADNGQKQQRSDLEARFEAAQQAEIEATLDAINRMKNTPPLRMLVNPSSVKNSSEKIIAEGNWTRNGPIIEHWGEGQDKLEASGRVAGFFAIDANNPNGEGEAPGLTRVARNFSAAYHNFLSLYLLYRNNAQILITDPKGATTLAGGNPRSQISMVGSVYIFYDDILYIGSFDSFNITETDDKPFTLEYSFQFTVRATFLLDRPDAHLAENQRKFEQNLVASTSTTTPQPEGGPVPPPPGFHYTETEQEQRNAVAAGGLPPGLTSNGDT